MLLNQNYETADEAVSEIKARVELITSLIPQQLLDEKYQAQINDKADEARASIEAERNSAIQAFDPIVKRFGYGCSLRAVVRKAKKLDQLNPRLDRLFQDSVKF